jgi:type I restriction enzyme S subunit
MKDDVYRSLGVKWYANGLFFKEPARGSEIKATRLFVVESGDFIYNRLFAWKGSFALAGPEHSGCVVSNEFPTFRVNEQRLLPTYLMAYFSSPRLWKVIAGQSSGTAEVSRLRFKEADFLRLIIPLPPMAEQKRIVTLLEEVNELRKVRAQANSRTAALIPAVFHEMFGDPTNAVRRWPSVPLTKLGTVTTGNTPPRQQTELYGNFIEWIKTDNIDSTRGIVTRATEGLSEEGASRGRIVPTGAILITCIAGSRGRIGDAAVTDRDVAINQQINAVVPNANTDSAFLCQQVVAVKRLIQSQATGNMTGIINKRALEQIPMVQPPLALQRQFGVRIAHIRALESGQAISNRRLDDLFQSMLDRAFSGKL